MVAIVLPIAKAMREACWRCETVRSHTFFVLLWLVLGEQARPRYVVMEKKNSKEYKTPKTKIVEVNVTNLICESPGGNEVPGEFEIN